MQSQQTINQCGIMLPYKSKTSALHRFIGTEESYFVETRVDKKGGELALIPLFT